MKLTWLSKNGQDEAAGLDIVTSEIIKIERTSLAVKLLKIFNMFLSENSITKNWLKELVELIFLHQFEVLLKFPAKS